MSREERRRLGRARAAQAQLARDRESLATHGRDFAISAISRIPEIASRKIRKAEGFLPGRLAIKGKVRA